MSSPGFRPDGVDGRKLSEAECDRLHFLKNRPDVPTIDGMPLDFPSYEYRAYPVALYRGQAESGLTLPRAEQLELDAYGRISRLAKDASEQRALESRGWCSNPADIKTAQNTYDEAIAQAAAERAFTDRRMSAAAKAEFHTANAANGDEHLLDLPVPKKKRAYHRKQTPSA